MSILIPSVPDSAQLHRDALTVLQPGFEGTTAPEWILRKLADGLGSVGIFGRNVTDPAQLAALTAQLRQENPDVLIVIDEEGGDVTRLEVGSGSSWPGNLALGAIDDPSLTRDVARELGRALAACGINFNWAPTADVNSNPGNPVIGVRSFGADPGSAPGTPPPGSRACSPWAWPPAPSTSPATATPTSTHTTAYRSSTSTRTCCGRATWCPSGPPWRPAPRP